MTETIAEKKGTVTILIPAPLRAFTKDERSWDVEARTVREALQKLIEEFPSLKKHLFDEKGKIRNFVNVFVNEEDIRHLQNEDTPIKEGDTIYIIPSIAGGAEVEVECIAKF